ncbi:hypothetical protein FRC19_006798 [Serendipita sp. 401]|nr:hypothetical protein FRC19_006798 [Serendipita sp. 401]
MDLSISHHASQDNIELAEILSSGSILLKKTPQQPVATLIRPLNPLFEMPLSLAKSTLEEARQAKVLLHLAIFLSYEVINLVIVLSNNAEDESEADGGSKLEGESKGEDELGSEDDDLQDLVDLAFTIESIYDLVIEWGKPNSELLDLDEQVDSAQRLYAELHSRTSLANSTRDDVIFNEVIALDRSAPQRGILGGSLIPRDVQIRISKAKPEGETARSDAAFIISDDSQLSSINQKQSPGLTTQLRAEENSPTYPGDSYSTVLTRACRALLASQVPEAERSVTRVLKVILVAATPLTIETINALLQVTNSRPIIEALSRVLDVKSDDTVLIRDPRFFDFLQDEEAAGIFYIDIHDANGSIAQSCFMVMMKELRFNICRIESSFVRNNEITNMNQRISAFISTQLQYAAIHWSKHLVKISEEWSETLNTMLGEFTRSPWPLYWMEVVSALGKVRSSLWNLQDTRDWISLKDEQCKQEIEDIHRFMVSFYTPISESIPHIYISAVPFGARESLLVRESILPFPNTFAVTEGYLKKWPDCSNMLRGHDGNISALVYSPNGRHIASGSDDGTIRLWDTETGMALGVLEGDGGSVNSISFSPDGCHIASGCDKIMQLWDIETGRELGGPLQGHRDVFTPFPVYPSERSVNSVSFSPNGHQIASGSRDGTIRLWDVETGKELGEPSHSTRNQGHHTRKHTLPDDSGSIPLVAFSTGERQIASGPSDGTVGPWDAEARKRLHLSFLHDRSPITSISFSPDGRQIVSGSRDGTIRLWDAETRKELGEPPPGYSSSIDSISFSPDGRLIASGSRDGKGWVWEAEAGWPSRRPLDGFSVSPVSFSPDGRQIVSGSHNGKVRLWDARTGQALAESFQRHGVGVSSVTFSPTGNQIASGSDDTTIRLWDVKIKEPSGLPELELFQPYQGLDVSTFRSRFVENWNALGVEDSDDDNTNIYLPHTRLVSHSRSGTIRPWGGETWKALGKPLESHQNRILSSSSMKKLPLEGNDRYSRVSDPIHKKFQLKDVKTGRKLTYPHLETQSRSRYSESPFPSPRLSILAGRELSVPKESTRTDPQSNYSMKSAQLQDDGWVVEGGRLLHWVPPFVECSIQTTRFKCGLQWTEVREVRREDIHSRDKFRKPPMMVAPRWNSRKLDISPTMVPFATMSPNPYLLERDLPPPPSPTDSNAPWDL